MKGTYITSFENQLAALASDGVLSPQVSLIGNDKVIWGKGTDSELIFVVRDDRLVLVNKHVVHNSFD